MIFYRVELLRRTTFFVSMSSRSGPFAVVVIVVVVTVVTVIDVGTLTINIHICFLFKIFF